MINLANGHQDVAAAAMNVKFRSSNANIQKVRGANCEQVRTLHILRNFSCLLHLFFYYMFPAVINFHFHPDFDAERLV